MAAHRKYFTEEERLAAKKRARRRCYLRSVAYVPVSRPKKTKQATYARRAYWIKKAIAQGLPAESWKRLYERHRTALKNRRGYWRPDRLEKARKSAKDNWEKHRHDPEYKARQDEAIMRWRKKNPERTRSIARRWYINNRDKVLSRQRAAYERDKRDDRLRLMLAIGGQ